MANDDSEQWHMPEPLRITNAMVAEQSIELRKQLEARAVSPFARRSPQEFALVRARARIPHLTTSLQQVDQEIRQNRGVVYGRKLQEARNALAARLAENLAIVGKFALAAELHPDPRYRQEYAKQVRHEVFL